jgi:hypothetical protein
MNANNDLERRIADFYETEAPHRAPDWVLGQALSTIDTTKQRRVLIRVPWRVPPMNSFAKLAIATVAVISVGLVALAVLRPGTGSNVGGPGGTPSPSPSPSPSPAASASPGPSVSPLPALTETFTSAMHGISVSYPSGWKLQPATEPWTTGIVQGDSAYADIIYEKESDSPFIAVASQPFAGKTFDDWATDYLAQVPCTQTGPVTVDGTAGVLSLDCELGPTALVSAGGRGYLIWLYRVDDLDWFKEILATVQLHPEDALDAAPSTSPSAS